MSLPRRFANGIQDQTGLSIFSLVRAGSRGLTSIYNPGTHIYEREWDILLVLDACRADMMHRIGPEFGFDDIETVWSIANMSDRWMERTFTEEYADAIQETAYITGNPFSAGHDLGVGYLEEIWRTEWEDELNGVPARPLTDRAIRVWQDEEPERMIVHYMQPHFPSVPHPDVGEFGDLDSFGKGWDTVWTDAGEEIPWDTVWEAYDANLRYVLEEVNLLLDNVEADQVSITADHGNSMGTLGVRGHPKDVLLPEIRRVPWIDTSGHGTGNYEPSTEFEPSDSEDNVEERLEALGYR